ncbi:Cytochrome c oxidase subunit CcoP [hydrothermal vent metagenome]|uniref:Cytochrome c oxidase subunit III n=1 Tax=hydrothermal vent metagenome TaxID=652676 RepID=A0A1W1CU79_9ZZZZ
MSEDKNPFPNENNTGHFWDDDIRELNNRPPRWYMWAFYFGVIMIVGYAFYYPTIPWFGGHNTGGAKWTAIKEFKEGVAELENARKKRFAKQEEAIKNKSLEEILKDSDLTLYAVKTARVLFGDNCASCHGAGGQGNVGFPVLADDDWLYGGSVKEIHKTITSGRKPMMTAHKNVLSESELETLANFVMNGAKSSDKKGQSLYMAKGCIGCHGADKKGNKFLGSANLTDSIWRFRAENQKDSVKKTIKHGVNFAGDKLTRNAEMPAFGKSEKLTKEQIKKLAIYVHELGGGK